MVVQPILVLYWELPAFGGYHKLSVWLNFADWARNSLY